MWIRSAFSAFTSMPRAQLLIAALVAATIGGVALYVTRPPVSGPALTASQSPDPLASSEIQTILPEDAIRAVDHPQFVSADKAGMRQNLSIIGIALGGEAHAFPIAIMSRVEIVNDRLGGKNIAVTW
jgi:uncharacterized protein DUF3179